MVGKTHKKLLLAIFLANAFQANSANADGDLTVLQAPGSVPSLNGHLIKTAPMHLPDPGVLRYVLARNQKQHR
jgi:hypothetical protein